MNGFGGVIGHGVDVIDLDDFARVVGPENAEHLSRYFTDAEIAAAGNEGTRLQHLGSKFSIKEAVLKALGVGFGDGIAFVDVEIVTSALGAPEVTTRRKVETLARERGIRTWHVSASHAGKIVFASVIATS